MGTDSGLKEPAPEGAVLNECPVSRDHYKKKKNRIFVDSNAYTHEH